jgi:uncharacterized protein (TIGR02996 family)
MRELTQAKAAAERGDLGKALAQLLAAWKKSPALAIADAIAAVSARAAASLQPPTGKTATAKNAAWDAAAKGGDPVARATLVASLTDTKGCADTLARIELLVAHDPDPRVSARIADLVETPAYNASVSRTNAFWKRVFALLPELGDPRIAERARRWSDAWRANKELNEPERPVLERRLAKIRDALDAVRAPALAADDAAAVAAIVAALGAPPVDTGAKTEDALVAAVVAAPHDDAARAVYADWLQQRNDPRGELIALQLAAKTRDGTRRANELVAEFGARWLAAYGDGIKKTTARFERGFLETCEPQQWGDGPLWATVRECSVPPMRDDQRADSLRVVTAAQDGHIVAFAKLDKPLAIESLTWNGPYWEEEAWSHDELLDSARATAAFSKIRTLPRLARLVLRGSSSWFGGVNARAVEPDDLAWLWNAKWTTALAALELPAELATAASWLEAAARKRLTTLELRSHAEQIWNGGWRATFERSQRAPERSIASAGEAGERDPGAAIWRLALVGPEWLKNPGYTRDHYADYITGALRAMHDLPVSAIRITIPAPAWKPTAAVRRSIAAALPGAVIEQA